jgi:elongation factor Ts
MFSAPFRDGFELRLLEERHAPALFKVVERERAVLSEQAKESGKPANVIEKMVEGRIRKFYEEVVLLAQAFVHDPDTTVAKAVAAAEKTAGAPIKITGFHRFALGEGIDRTSEETA